MNIQYTIINKTHRSFPEAHNSVQTTKHILGPDFMLLVIM